MVVDEYTLDKVKKIKEIIVVEKFDDLIILFERDNNCQMILFKKYCDINYVDYKRWG